MDKLTRLYKLHRVLTTYRHPVSMRVLMDRLECSRATVARAIEEMRLYFSAPLEYVREANGYAYVGEQAFQLPGFWLSERELLALLTLEQLVAEIGHGVLADQLQPIAERIRRQLAAQGIAFDSGIRRVVLTAAFRHPADPRLFAALAEATLRRRRLRIAYHNRWDDAENERTVSPQRLVHHRGNWYLEAWCHLRNDLRTFALDRIGRAEVLDEAADDIDVATLARHFDSSFGIYSGEPTALAVLRFSTWQARWTEGELWHPQQKMRKLDDGRIEIEVPYSSDGELLMDALAHAPHIEVVSPPELRAEFRRRLELALALHLAAHDSATLPQTAT
jgi:predicted DNA-binding transcriptional regulator YafY